VALYAGPATCILGPDLGGSIFRWTIDGQDMLRNSNDAAVASRDPLQTASFPLVPFSNRIANGMFNWQGRKMAIRPNFAPEPHAIHGLGWKVRWEIIEQSETQSVLYYRHTADDRWGWPFAATQTFTLGDNMLKIAMEAVNLADEPTPLAFGHHPYFDQHNANLTFEAEQFFMADANGLPTCSATPTGAFDFSKGKLVEGHGIDNCYAGWNGEAQIVWKNRPLGLRIVSDMPAAVLYIPKDGDAFCFEPVPHINNALNLPGQEPAMPVIQPREAYRSTITMFAVPAAQL
jgi:aldose 1-epimerase